MNPVDHLSDFVHDLTMRYSLSISSYLHKLAALKSSGWSEETLAIIHLKNAETELRNLADLVWTVRNAMISEEI